MRPIHSGIDPADQIGRGPPRLRHQFKERLIFQGGLLGFAQPSAAQRLQTCHVAGRYHVTVQRRAGKRQDRARARIQLPGCRSFRHALKRPQRGVGLRTHHAVNRTRRKTLPRQGNLRLQNIPDRSRKPCFRGHRHLFRRRFDCRQRNGSHRYRRRGRDFHGRDGPPLHRQGRRRQIGHRHHRRRRKNQGGHIGRFNYRRWNSPLTPLCMPPKNHARRRHKQQADGQPRLPPRTASAPAFPGTHRV